MSILEMALSVDNPNPAVSSSSSSSSSSCLNLVNQESLIKAAVKLQKVYRSYRTRRRLADDAIADDAVVAEEFWWQLLDYARLNHSTVSFFNFHKPEKAASRWCRVSSNASKVGKGLCEDRKAKKLAFQHWIEAIDPRHRYGHNLNFYYEEWHKSKAGQPFFYWLDIGDGREVDLKECPRLRLREQSIKYLGPLEREHYEYVIEDGAMVHKQTGNLLDTKQEQQGSNKWIFVMSSSKRLYAGEKKKGKFHHSSFLAGGTTLAAGSLTAEKGKLKSASAYSGHYRPTDENLGNFIAFLEENEINLDQVQVLPPTEDYKKGDISKSIQNENRFCKSTSPGANKQQEYSNIQKKQTSDSSICAQDQITSSYKSLAKGKDVLGRSKFKKEASSYLLGHQLRNG